MKNSPAQAAAAELRAYALTFPGATEEFPWGESAFKVKGKVFVFMRASAEGLGMSMKLPQSNATALDKSFAQPTGYGLGKSGWVTCTFEGGERVPIEVLKPWIVESWRAVAPKTLVKQFDGGGVAVASGTPSALSRKADSKSGRDNKTPPLDKTATNTGKSSKKVVRESGKSASDSARKLGKVDKRVARKSGKVDGKSGRKSATRRARKRA